MKVKLKKKCGDLEFEIEAEGKDEKEIFAQLAFWTTLPAKHPKGATDFQIRVRPATTAAGKRVKYYELACPSTGERFSFGQATDEAGGGLFPKKWEKIFGVDEIHSEEEGDHLTEEPAPFDTSAAPRKTSDNVLPIEAKKLSIEDLNKRAAQLVREGRVACEGNKCIVRANDRIHYEVARGADRKLTCQCERFGAHKDCEHVRAVRLLYSTPKPDGKTEVSMLIADVRQAGCSQETIDALLAKLCDGLFDPAQMDDAQIQKAKKAFQFKLEELNAQRKAA